MTTYICKCGRRVKKSTDASTTGNRLSGYAPGHECWGCPYAMPYGNYQWDESTRTVRRETQGYECRMSKTLTYASEFAGSIKDKCTCRVHSLDFDFLSQVSAWIKDTYPDREIFGSFSKDIRASDYGSDGRYCLTITCTQNLKGVAAKRELLGQFFTPNGSRKDMTPQQEMEKILADIKKAKEIFSCTPAQNADAAVTTAENAVPTATAATPTTSESGADANASTPATSLQNCESVPTASAGGSSVPMPSAPGFDFSALGELSEQALETDQQFDLHYGTAQDEYLISCIYVAKMHALTAKAGRYGGGTWTKWYESKGMSKSSVWNMLQTGEGFKGSTVEQLTSIPELSRKDLNLIARSGCADQLVQAAGNDQRVQELLDQLKAERDRATAAEAREEEARQAAHMYHTQLEDTRAHRNELLDQQGAYIADLQSLTEQNHQLQQRADAAEAREEEAWRQREKAEQHARDAEAALKHQPIATVVDKEEVRRQAEELSRQAKESAHKAVQEAQAQTAEAQARLRQFQQAADGYLAPEQVCAQQAQMIADSMRTMYLGWFGKAAATGCPLAQMATPLYALCGEIMSSLEDDTSIDPTAAGSVEDAEREALFE